MIAQPPSPASAPAPRIAAAPDASGPDVSGGAAGAFAILLAGLLPAPPLMLGNAAVMGLDSSDLGAAAAVAEFCGCRDCGPDGAGDSAPGPTCHGGAAAGSGRRAAGAGRDLADARCSTGRIARRRDGARSRKAQRFRWRVRHPGSPVSGRRRPPWLAAPRRPRRHLPARRQGGTPQPAARMIAPAELPVHRPESAAVAAAGSPNLAPPASAASLVPMPGRPTPPGATATTETEPEPASSKPDVGAVRSQNPRAAGTAQPPIAPRPSQDSDRPVALEHVDRSADAPISAGDATTTTRLGGPPGESTIAPTRSSPPPPAVQLGLQIAAAAPHRVERMVVQLDPPDLGRVEVRLDFGHDNHVSAQIAADRPETLAVLQRDSHALERGLQHAGLQLDNKGLNFSLRQEQRQQGAASQTPPRFDPASTGSERDWSEAQPVRWFAAERVLDLRI